MRSPPTQSYLPFVDSKGRSASATRASRASNDLGSEDRPFHAWYRFVLSFPPHLVRRYIQAFGLDSRHVILDPFCGTGTTLVESRRNGIPSIGLEANPFAHFASTVKVDWTLDPGQLQAAAHAIAENALNVLRAQGIHDNEPFRGNVHDMPLRRLSPAASRLLIKNSISPLPLHKSLVLLDCLQGHRSRPSCYTHGLLALAKALVFSISNLRFGPEVGAGKPKHDVPVVASWLSEVSAMARDLRLLGSKSYPTSDVHLADARDIGDVIEWGSVDAVITSPPYPNEKDYTRTTRLESVVLGFVKNRAELRQFKKALVRSNTRGVYKADNDDRWITGHQEIRRIAASIEKRRKALGKTSGFERLYARVTRLYFGGMARHLAELRRVLRPGARLAYVVGDQASYLRIMIRTGQLLAEIAQALGYELLRVDLFRTRFATATREQLREEVVVLRWPGEKG